MIAVVLSLLNEWKLVGVVDVVDVEAVDDVVGDFVFEFVGFEYQLDGFD